MKWFEVWSDSSGDRWNVVEPDINNCYEAREYVAKKYNLDYWELGAIRMDSGEARAQQDAKEEEDKS